MAISPADVIDSSSNDTENTDDDPSIPLEDGRNEVYDSYAIGCNMSQFFGYILLNSDAKASMDYEESPLAGAYADWKDHKNAAGSDSQDEVGNLRAYRDLIDNEPPEGFVKMSKEVLNNGIKVPTADGGEKALSWDIDESDDDLWLPDSLVNGSDDIPAILDEPVSDNDEGGFEFENESESGEKGAESEEVEPRDVCKGVKGDGSDCDAKSEMVQETGYCGHHQSQHPDNGDSDDDPSPNISDALREKIMQLPSGEREEAFEAMLE